MREIAEASWIGRVDVEIGAEVREGRPLVVTFVAVAFFAPEVARLYPGWLDDRIPESEGRIDMERIKLQIPADFILRHARVSWRELQYGLLNDLIGAHAVIECAVNEVGSTDQPSPEVLELAGSDASDPVAERVARLAASEPAVSEDDVRGKWLYLTLAWLYARRDALPEPLQVVEEVYADFGYPEEMATFIRYMPMEGPDLGSREANEGRMIAHWKRYVDAAEERYRP